MIISDIMSRNPVTANIDSPINEIAEKINKNKFHGIPVIDDDNRVIGIVTESDFFMKGSISFHLPSFIDMLDSDTILEKMNIEKKEQIKKLLSAKVLDIMSSPCVTIDQNASLEELLLIIKEKKLHSIPVINNENKLVGIITLVDLINLMKIK